MKCTQCGFENPDGFAFCGKCGTQLTADQSIIADAPPSLDEEQLRIEQLKQAGDAARRAADAATAIKRYSEALSLLDSTVMGADATLHLHYLRQRFELLAARVSLWNSVDQYNQIEVDLQEMLVLARRSGDGLHLSTAIMALARFYLDGRRYESARPLLEEAVSLLRTQNDHDGEALALVDLAYVDWRDGYFEPVAAAIQRAHELRRHVADPSALAQSYFNLGILYRDGLSQAFHAVNHFEKALEYAHDSAEAKVETTSLIELGVSWARLGDYTRARNALEQAQRRIDASGSPAHKATLLIAQADVMRETALDEAHRAADQAVNISSGLDRPDLKWNALRASATISQDYQEWDVAQITIKHMRKFEQTNSLYAYCSIWTSALLARNHLYSDQHQAALETSTRAVDGLLAHGHHGVPLPQTILWTHYQILDAGNDETALHFLRQAREALLSQANAISDGALRANFLRDVSVNRSIGDQWTRIHL